MSVRPRWKQGVPYVGSKQQAPGKRQHKWLRSGDTDHRSYCKTDTGPRFRLKIGVPGGEAEMWHSQLQEAVRYLASYRFTRCVSLAICEPAPETPNSAQPRGAVGFLRV